MFGLEMFRCGAAVHCELPSPSQSRLLLPPDGDAGGEGGG
jgi:hypothetical protein